MKPSSTDLEVTDVEEVADRADAGQSPDDETPSGPHSISLCLVVHDEVEHLQECIEALRPLVDEVICWDQGSTDGSGDVAREYADTYIKVPYKGNVHMDYMAFPMVARCQWILNVEADERLSPPLERFVRNWRTAPQDNVEAIWALRKNVVNGKNIESVTGREYHLLLWRNDRGRAESMVSYLNPIGPGGPQVKSDFQCWLSDGRHTARHHDFEEMVQRHRQYRRAVEHHGLRRPVAMEGEIIVRLAHFLGHPLAELEEEGGA